MKKYLLFFSIFLFLLVLGIVYFREDEYILIENKVKLVNQVFLKNTDSFSAMRDIHIKNSSTKKKLDSEITSYLDSILNQRLLIESVLNRTYSFDIRRIEEDSYLEESIDIIHTQSTRLSNYISSFQTILSNNKSKDSDKFKEILEKLELDEVNHYIENCLKQSEEMSDNIKILEFLNHYKNEWNYNDGVIVVQKRKIFNEYLDVKDSSIKKDISVELIHDTTGPVIDTKNVTIYLNQTISLENQVSCYDEVDEEVSCQIDGTYDSSKVGEYPIKVYATDQSNNVSESSFIVKVIRKVNQKPYSIDVIRNQNIVIVYGLDDEGDYSKIVKVFTCSTGSNNGTPTGNYSTSKGSVWGALYGGVWGQYTTRIVGSILFHSVPYYSRNKGDLEWEEYNKLGSAVSMGCVRLTVRDAKWIFYNIPVGTAVHIYDGSIPEGVSKPFISKIDGSSPNRGWDPTDDDPSNLW